MEQDIEKEILEDPGQAYRDGFSLQMIIRVFEVAGYNEQDIEEVKKKIFGH